MWSSIPYYILKILVARKYYDERSLRILSRWFSRDATELSNEVGQRTSKFRKQKRVKKNKQKKNYWEKEL